ncbi:MAG: NAD(P)H:quinone oxidoreductase [Pseudomonadota bacterium]
MTRVLIVAHSVHGNTLAMAREIARGVEEVEGAEAVLRAVEPITSAIEPRPASVPEDGPSLVDRQDLQDCDALILGSPTRFGNMASSMKYFLDGTGSEWFSGVLAGKPAGVFTSTASMHGGQEATLLSMMIPLLHHGMLMVGLPYSEPALTRTMSGGTPYGPSHLAGPDSDRPLDDDERRLCRVLGQRVATIAGQLK